MEYLWTFLIVTWFTGEDMKIVTQNAPSYEACELMREGTGEIQRVNCVRLAGNAKVNCIQIADLGRARK